MKQEPLLTTAQGLAEVVLLCESFQAWEGNCGPVITLTHGHTPYPAFMCPPSSCIGLKLLAVLCSPEIPDLFLGIAMRGAVASYKTMVLSEGHL